MTRVYVVLGESGEYSDREVWVSGVYETEAEAQAAIVERMAVRRTYDAWSMRKQDVYRQMSEAFREQYPEEARTLGWRRLEAIYPDLCAPYLERLNREEALRPEYEAAERCTLLACPIGQWGVCGEALEEHEA